MPCDQHDRRDRAEQAKHGRHAEERDAHPRLTRVPLRHLEQLALGPTEGSQVADPEARHERQHEAQRDGKRGDAQDHGSGRFPRVTLSFRYHDAKARAARAAVLVPPSDRRLLELPE
jgi:hypothetical protein